MSIIGLDDVSTKGRGESGPGEGPDLSQYPLLVWTRERGVMTEDGKVTARHILDDWGGGCEEMARRFGTTRDHILQAVEYLGGL